MGKGKDFPKSLSLIIPKCSFYSLNLIFAMQAASTSKCNWAFRCEMDEVCYIHLRMFKENITRRKSNYCMDIL